MHAMQRRSGDPRVAPDQFVITSLDVVIHHHKKLGQGGFGQVFEGEWQGNSVAVKVLDKGVTPSVSLGSCIFPFRFDLFPVRSSNKKSTYGNECVTLTFWSSLARVPLQTHLSLSVP